MTDKKEQISAREIALGILMDIVQNSNFSHTVMSRTLNQYQYLEKQDRAFITRLCEGTIERMLTLDYILNQYSSVKVNKMKPLIRNLLRMSLYQVKYMDQIPDSAACNEAVKLAKKRGFGNLSGFVNGVLRNIVRDTKKVSFPNEETEKEFFLSVVYSVPEWLVKHFLSQYDYTLVKSMLEASFQDKKTIIRCNTDKITVEDLTVLLKQNKVTVEPGTYLPYALKIWDYNFLGQLNAFKKGYFQVQDESSMLVGAVSGVRSGDYIIDVCAAPGGKSLHLAELLKSSGHVDSRDVSEAKVNLINENILRNGYTNIKAYVTDALILDEESIEKADIVIADLPCSGLGVISKKPDIKYNMTREKQKNLVKLQRDILTVVQQYVKKGGTLLYSTCTVNIEENLENVRWFTEHFDYRMESIDEFLPSSLLCDTSKEGYIQLLPGIHNTDGFFIAKLRRKN
ncbi:16S rRNA (cytosine(967)-C(5))-methyltransferase RsmB [Anaerocolumna sp. MB42-C2]|uniref:16S rRNA (cytosine(967)-C(5))-methyltransferase RsmB n=1 Tax=Anaerocolumna sp. MB42-C2 TaxID=3070997 RepID=UPI0027DF204B|nr:16S rRNA (cytosine(967)-C(5))-methyltransferase RsmB [Anaerocolumna sp. MB42-C2]WMJ88485.1 16S rRNA (cytosine(967)-C(5))-methyltransferase RsmB [Anaerocolumna sp. MB42-C2]